jgi:hypothetical protein
MIFIFALLLPCALFAIVALIGRHVVVAVQRRAGLKRPPVPIQVPTAAERWTALDDQQLVSCTLNSLLKS